MNFFISLFIIIYFIAYKIESGKIRPNFEEIFGEGWHKNEREEKAIKIEKNEQVNQNVQIENVHFVDQMGENGNGPNDQQKREIIRKFEAIKEKLKEKGKLERKDQNKIETKIGKLLGTNRDKIYKWKKELNLNKKSYYEQKKCEFIERIDEFKSLYGQGKQKEFVKELGIAKRTFIKWKKEFTPKYSKIHANYSNKDKFTMMNEYFEIKERNPKIGDEIIAKKLGIGIATLKRWKKKFILI